MQEDQKSKMTAFENPGFATQEDYNLNMAEPGSKINGIIKRHLRRGLIVNLRKTMTEYDAVSHADHLCELIIKAHLIGIDSKYYRRLMNDEEVNKIKEQYPAELKFIDGISNRIKKGDSLRQISFSLGE